jgi:4-hydroxythreonine-4-phosphate dehydrogenase
MSEPKKTLPLVGISAGDINGIGPEVIISTLSDSRIMNMCTPVIYGSSKVFGFYRKKINQKHFNYSVIDKLTEAVRGKINILNVGDTAILAEPGKITKEAGQLSLAALQASVKDLKDGSIDALVTAPINKDNIQSDQFKFAGHTEYLAQEDKAKDYLMLMACETLKVGVVTSHIPLKDVSKGLTKESIISKITILNNSLKKDYGIRKPKIAVLGLNPHAGENGLLGKEEQEVITPALDELRNKNILVSGPLSADGFFGNRQQSGYDGVMAMYHDQGLIPFKTIAFEEGVNYTAGLSFIRTSPDHGTAYSIAGKGLADPTSFRQALFMALDIYKSRKENIQ